MSYDFPSFGFCFGLTIDHPLSFISSFLKFVLLVIFIWKDLPAMMDFHLIWRWITESGNPVGLNSLSKGFCLFSRFDESTCHPSLWLTIFIPSHISPSPIVHPCIVKGHSNHQLSTHHETCLSLSHVHVQLISFHVISWHFVLTWLLSLSLSRRGIMLEELRSRLRFLRLWWCGCVRARC